MNRMYEWSAIYKETNDATREEIDKEHMHPNMHQIVFVTEGEMELNTRGRDYYAKKGSISFISNIEMHCVKVRSFPYKRYIVNVDESFIRNIQASKELTSILNCRTEDFEHCINVIEILDKLKYLFGELAKETERKEKENPYNYEAASSLLMLILITLFREKPEAFPMPHKDMDSTIFQVKEYIDNNYIEDITVNSLSEQFYISQSYLTQNLKQLTGYSPKRYIMLCRIAAARSLLYKTDMPISEIAVYVGFNDTSNFIRYFKKETGKTPFQFRKSLKTLASSKN